MSWLAVFAVLAATALAVPIVLLAFVGFQHLKFVAFGFTGELLTCCCWSPEQSLDLSITLCRCSSHPHPSGPQEQQGGAK